jgi:hypothetical protein
MQCINCGIRIVQIGHGVNERWIHQIKPDQILYTHCKLSIAEPVIKVVETNLDIANRVFKDQNRRVREMLI